MSKDIEQLAAAANIAATMPDLDTLLATLQRHKDKLQLILKMRTEIQRLRKKALPCSGGDEELKIIIEETALEFNVDTAELFSRSKLESVMLPRQVVSWLARNRTELSLAAIGKVMGKDHGTIHHGCRRVSDRMDVDKEFKGKVLRLDAVCKNRIKQIQKEESENSK